MQTMNNRAPLYQRIYAVVNRIPRGSVASYGRIAKMVNCTARQVGYAMAATPPGRGIPWHRVINSKGEISARKGGGDGDTRQKQKLLSEGVVFDAGGRVDFHRFGWVESGWVESGEVEPEWIFSPEDG